MSSCVKKKAAASFWLPESSFRFGSYYTDHMVLQRAPQQAVVWGYARRVDGHVTIQLDGKTAEIAVAFEGL